MYKKTISELAEGLEQGEFNSQELTEHYIERIKQYNPTINAFITIVEDQARLMAKQADRKRQKGQAGPLTGVPIAHKDIFCTEGVNTTCGSKMLANFVSPYDATCVSKLKQAGVVMLGKTNMDEFAMGSSSETSYMGSVKNPWDTGVVAGGSSGGSAAAVVARLVPAATGTDTGGSIRQPAALCGITGLKPTYGRVSRYGMIAFASSLDQAGPMTQTAKDAALMLNEMAGFDSLDSTSVERDKEDFSRDLAKSLKGLRIGLPKEYFEKGLDAGIAKIIEAALKVYEDLGATLKQISLPNSALAIPTYYVIAPAECSSNLSRYDGVRYGYRCKDPIDLEDLYKRSRSEGFGVEVKRRILIGTYVLSAYYYDAYYIKAQKLRQLISQDFKAAFEQVDVIMGPTTPSVAFPLGAKTEDPVNMYLSDIYTTAVNLAGLPGMSIPAGFYDNKPVGLQIIGSYFDEARLLNVAHQYQQVSQWHKQIPEDFQK